MTLQDENFFPPQCSQKRFGFNTRAVHIGFLVDTVALREVFPPKILYFPVTTTTKSPNPFVYSTIFTEEVWIQYQSNPYRICGGHSGIKESFSPENFLFPCHNYHKISTPIRLLDNIHRRGLDSIPEQSIWICGGHSGIGTGFSLK
jgi:hypothetical protein